MYDSLADQKGSKKTASILVPPVSPSAQSSSQTRSSSGHRAPDKSVVPIAPQANIGVVRAQEPKVPVPPPKRSTSRDNIANIGVRRQPSPPKHLSLTKKRREYLSKQWESSQMDMFLKQKEQESHVPPQVPDPPKYQGPPPTPRPVRLPTPDLPEICSCKDCRCMRGFHKIQGHCDILGGPGNTKMGTQLVKASAHIQAQKITSGDNGSQGRPVHVIRRPRTPSHGSQSLIQPKRTPNQSYDTLKDPKASIHDLITAGVRIMKGPASVAVHHSAPRNLKSPVQGQIGNIASPRKRLRVDDQRSVDIKEAAWTLTKLGYPWSEAMSALEKCGHNLEMACPTT
ncbi:hypothetical protein B7494_g4189 [Chlorociboria aeruginascens]|nr:hypothetical protein B7494_g4189 [Chlorociboria aeruginascens]